MKTVYLEQRSSTKGVEHNKFYRIIDNGSSVITKWGAIGCDGKQKTLIISDDVNKRVKTFNKKLESKKSGGYVIINADGQQLELRPEKNGRKWGVEIETHSKLSSDDVAAKMQQRGLNVNLQKNSYFKSKGVQWDIKRDGSCGYEFASPILSGQRGFFDAKLAVEKIREICPTATNGKCGLHVTVDVSDHSNSDLKRLIIAYLLAQNYFYSECDDSRQNNKYCKKNPAHHVKNMNLEENLNTFIAWATPNGRYHGLNLSRLIEKRIVEFRMMESTVSIRKVGAWIRMCVNFVNSIKKSHILLRAMSKEDFERIVNYEF